MRHLIAGECDMEGISRESTIAVGNHMRTHAARPYARVIFDDDLPAVSLQAPFIVFRTNGLKLPDREELANAHRFEQMSPDRLFGRAYYALLAHAVYEISNADRSRFTLFPVDEAAGRWPGTAGPLTRVADRVLDAVVEPGHRAVAS
mgnify:CR=1 FL=1